MCNKWFHGSPQNINYLRIGSTITKWKELAIAFSHKPTKLEYDYVGGKIEHNGKKKGLLYVIDEKIIEGIDIEKHPRTTMDDGVEWLTKREIKLKLSNE